MNDDRAADRGLIATIVAEKKHIEVNGLEVDIQTWAKMRSWTVLQAVCIFYGLDPVRGLQSENLKPFPIYKQIMVAYDIMINAASNNKIPREGDPMLFFDEAELAGITVSEELKNAVLEEGNKRDMSDLEKQSRMKDFTDNPKAISKKAGAPIFTVNMTKEIRETFHEEIRDILFEFSASGERIPTGAEMMRYLKGNPDKAKHLVEVNRRKEILFKTDAPDKKIATMSRDALHKLILRHTKKLNKPS